jgi:hypothetical protein
MKKIFFIMAAPLLLVSCSDNKKEKQEKQDLFQLPLTDTLLINKGAHLVMVSGCNDCHSPKMMTEHGPVPDPALLLSGHPEKLPLAPYDTATIKNWVLFNMNMTAVRGPWGTSFSANLTPDPSGIGNWTEQQFSNALRKGYFKGVEGGRMLLPPMPWPNFAHFTDDEVHAIFAYLKSIKPVKNYVPAAIPPGA